MTLVPTDLSKDKLKQCEDLWKKIEDLIRSISNNCNNYDERYMKTKFNSADGLPLKKKLEFHHVVIVVKSVFFFNVDKKYYQHVF